MIRRKAKRKPVAGQSGLSTDLLLLPDGRVLVHNLTPAFAEILSKLNPGDSQIQARRRSGTSLRAKGALQAR